MAHRQGDRLNDHLTFVRTVRQGGKKYRWRVWCSRCGEIFDVWPHRPRCKDCYPDKRNNPPHESCPTPEEIEQRAAAIRAEWPSKLADPDPTDD